MELFFIRHGQSSNNALADPTQRVQDPLLTPAGEKQAERVAEHIAAGLHLVGGNVGEQGRAPLDRLYCSAMVRAMRTAQPIGKALGMAPEVYIDIHEFGGIFLDRPDGGTEGFPGQTRAEMERDFPGYTVPAAVGEDGWWKGGRETEAAQEERAARTARDLWARAESTERVGLVSHGDYLNLLLKKLLGIQGGEGLYLYHRNTAITRIHLYADGTSDLYYLNRTVHIEPDLMT